MWGKKKHRIKNWKRHKDRRKTKRMCDRRKRLETRKWHEIFRQKEERKYYCERKIRKADEGIRK